MMRMSIAWLGLLGLGVLHVGCQEPGSNVPDAPRQGTVDQGPDAGSSSTAVPADRAAAGDLAEGDAAERTGESPGQRGDPTAPAVREPGSPATPAEPYVPGQAIATGDAAWDLYNASQKRWQQEVQDLLARRRPDLQEVSQATLRMQWALLDMRACRIRYLLQHDPERFVRDQGLARFIHFQWTAADDADLRELDTEYGRLEARVEVLRAQALAHADYAASREVLRELLLDPEFRETVTRWTASGQEVERLLQPPSGHDPSD